MRANYRTILFNICLLFCICFQAFSQSQESFNNANDLYNDGKYAEAIDEYQKILDNGQHSAELYFNLGNSYYKINNIAPSIYYYEKALQLKPNDKEIKNNLVFAQNMTIDAIKDQPEVGFRKLLNTFSKTFSYESWSKLAIMFVVLFVIAFLAYYFAVSSAKKRIYFISSFVIVVFVGVSLFMAFHNYSLYKNDKPAIVFAQESQVKSEPNPRGTVAFTIHEGTKVQVLDTIDDWKRISLSDGQTGWIESSDIKLLKNF